jgi:hypothetical protein
MHRDVHGAGDEIVRQIVTSIDLWTVLTAVGIIALASWAFRRIRGGHRPDTTITFGRSDPEPVLDDAPLLAALDDQQWDNAREVVPELVNVLTVMQTSLDGLDAIDYRSLARERDGVPNSVRQIATETFGRIRHLDQSTVPFLPNDLSKGWYSLLQLLEDLRRYGHGSSEAWSDVVLNRNRRDVVAYLAFVRTSLIEFANTGAIAEHCEPPDLRRSSPDAWAPN